MDINMPIMDGFEATQLIRELQQKHSIWQNVIIAILTAFQDEQGYFKSKEVKANYYIPKPINRNTLANILKQGQQELP